MRSKTVKLRHSVDLFITETVSITTGRPIVEMRGDSAYDDGIDLTPAEARSLARALTAMADVADAKRSKATP